MLTWYLTLREEHTLTVFEKRVLRKIFGPKREEVTVEWRPLMIYTAHRIYFRDKIKKNEMRRACGTYGGEEKHIQGFGGET
jgi:hypothetical protein